MMMQIQILTWFPWSSALGYAATEPAAPWLTSLSCFPKRPHVPCTDMSTHDQGLPMTQERSPHRPYKQTLSH